MWLEIDIAVAVERHGIGFAPTIGTRCSGTPFWSTGIRGGHRSIRTRRQAVDLVGAALPVKSSMSIVIAKLPFERGLTGDKLYSVSIASGVGFEFLAPFLLAHLLT